MIFKEKTNLSLIYILPLIAEAEEGWYEFKNKYIPQEEITTLVNGYRGDVNKPWLDKRFFLMFESRYDKDFDITTLSKKKNYRSTYNYRLNKSFYNIVSFSIPKEYMEVYEIILKGDLDLIPSDINKRILKFWLYNDRLNAYRMIYPEEKPNIHINKFDYELIGEKDDTSDWYSEIG